MQLRYILLYLATAIKFQITTQQYTNITKSTISLEERIKHSSVKAKVAQMLDCNLYRIVFFLLCTLVKVKLTCMHNTHIFSELLLFRKVQSVVNVYLARCCIKRILLDCFLVQKVLKVHYLLVLSFYAKCKEHTRRIILT